MPVLQERKLRLGAVHSRVFSGNVISIKASLTSRTESVSHLKLTVGKVQLEGSCNVIRSFVRSFYTYLGSAWEAHQLTTRPQGCRNNGQDLYPHGTHGPPESCYSKCGLRISVPGFLLAVRGLRPHPRVLN